MPETKEHRVPLINGPNGATVKFSDLREACDVSHTRGYEKGHEEGYAQGIRAYMSYAAGVIFGDVQPMDSPYCEHPDRCNSPDACGLTNVFQQMHITYLNKAAMAERKNQRKKQLGL